LSPPPHGRGVPRHPQRPIPKKKVSERKPFCYRTLVVHWTMQLVREFSISRRDIFPIGDFSRARVTRFQSSEAQGSASSLGYNASPGKTGSPFMFFIKTFIWSTRKRGFTLSLARALRRSCKAATLSELAAARLFFSEGSCAMLYRSAEAGSKGRQISFQSPCRTAARNGSTL
jgi:hypothetical protein